MCQIGMAVVPSTAKMATRTEPTPGVFLTLPYAAQAMERGILVPSQQGRLLGAMIDAVAEKGYNATTVADVVARASVSRRAFYEHFSDKDDCYLAAYGFAADLLLERCAVAVSEDEEPSEQVESFLRAYLANLAAVPSVARAFLVEVRGASPAARETHREVLDRFVDLMAELPSPVKGEERTRQLRVAAVAAIEELTGREVADGRATELPELLPVVLSIAGCLITKRQG
jgi:AcrR family transcriptional regulator